MQITLDFPVYETKVKFINKSDNANPKFQTEGSAGFDITADLRHPIMLEAGEFKLISTGLYFELPENLELQIRPRSGLAAKFGITVLNSPGTIDSDYRGEVKVILINHSRYVYKVQNGLRIAQGILNEVKGKTMVEFVKVNVLSETDRGDGGIGSTGGY
tara:strand:+ start:219 stop:695 length:477 start_codon:yes stop_codon:yes gene_type:complete